MALSKLEREAVQKLEQEIGERLERERKGLEETQLKWTKMQIRVKLFGESDLKEEELELWNATYPQDMERHQAEIARLKGQLEQLQAFAGE
jgi:hypothetical protein